MIIVDNVARRGRVAGMVNLDSAVVGFRSVFEEMKRRVDCTSLQTVGSKRWDGFAIALVVE